LTDASRAARIKSGNSQCEELVRNAVKLRLTATGKPGTRPSRLHLFAALAGDASLQPAFVERALSLGNNQRRNRIADQVRWCERLRHQPVDAEDEGNTLDRTVPTRRVVCSKLTAASPRTSAIVVASQSRLALSMQPADAGHPGNAVHHRAEDDGRDQRADHPL
jgi:hypothetical protein